MFRNPTIAIQRGWLSTFTSSLLRKSSGGGVIAICSRPFNYSTANALYTEMPKRKRAVVVKAELTRKLSTVKTENYKSAAGEEDYEPELAPTEEEDSEGFGSDFDGGGHKKGTKKKASVKSKGPGKAATKKKPTVSRKDKIKTEDKNGNPITRPPQVNTDYVPIPWKGRLGFACLNTYLRTANPPIFCSRTCRISTILQKGTPAEGRTYVESLGLANAWDLCKLIRWNEKYGIKFLRISSEMFPFASHEKYGYSLDFAAEPLREAGRLAMKYGHRLTTHPGQYTQLASPRKEVITASLRDLEYHSQLLQLLGLEGQADRDAVMILHMGGVFGDKAATINRFRESYTTLLNDDIKARLVLENDDVNYTVHDLLPICNELNIPLVLDYHHHNILRRPDLREGTLDLLPFLPEIKATWTRKNITQKQHYSEPRDDAVTDRDMRKHSKRVRALPPCDDTMDLMIEAKDKEQAVFELYRKYGIGGEGLFNEVVPHVRKDENPVEVVGKGKKKGVEEEVKVKAVDDEDVAMGGAERRVYWPEGNEDWLSPAKKVRKKKEVTEEEEPEEEDGMVVEKNTTGRRRLAKQIKKEAAEDVNEELSEAAAKKEKAPAATGRRQSKKSEMPEEPEETSARKTTKPPAKKSKRTIKAKIDAASTTVVPAIVIPRETEHSQPGQRR